MLSPLVISLLSLLLVLFFFFTISVIRRKNNNPKTSYLMAFINICLQPFRTFQMGLLKEPVKLEEAMKSAITTTKLTDFGDLSFLDNYRVVADMSFYKNLNFSNLGLVMAKLEMSMGMMSRRLHLVDFLKSFPAVGEVPVVAPLIVVGIGRAGTTFLHRLLELDPDVRSPRLWELMIPIPWIKEEYTEETKKLFEEDREKRAADARQQIEGRDALGDKTMENIHHIEADAPEECIVGLSNEIPLSYHFLYSCFTHMTEYFDALPQGRFLTAYQSYRKILQLLSYQVGEGYNPRRWVLKSPLHSYFIKELEEVFPDAKIVWPHRNPQKCLSSHCSMLQGLHLMYYERDCLSPTEIGQLALRENKHMLSRGLKALDESKLECAHVMFDDIVNNPVDIVKQIYDQFSMKFSSEHEKRIQDYIAKDTLKRNKLKEELKISGHVSLNKHTLEEFGLSPSDVQTEQYTAYIRRFGLDKQKH